MFEHGSIVTFNQSMNIKFKRHTGAPKFVHPFLWIRPACLSNFIHSFAK